MKACLIMLLRISTGLLLVLWGVIRVASPERTSSVAERYYSGMLSAETLQPVLGYAEIALGVFVCLGLLRKIVYPAQAIVLGLGALMIWNHLLDPLAVWLVEPENRRTLFFPSLCVAFAAFVPMVFKEYDNWTLDRVFGWKY